MSVRSACPRGGPLRKYLRRVAFGGVAANLRPARMIGSLGAQLASLGAILNDSVANGGPAATCPPSTSAPQRSIATAGAERGAYRGAERSRARDSSGNLALFGEVINEGGADPSYARIPVGTPYVAGQASPRYAANPLDGRRKGRQGGADVAGVAGRARGSRAGESGRGGQPAAHLRWVVRGRRATVPPGEPVLRPLSLARGKRRRCAAAVCYDRGVRPRRERQARRGRVRTAPTLRGGHVQDRPRHHEGGAMSPR